MQTPPAVIFGMFAKQLSGRRGERLARQSAARFVLPGSSESSPTRQSSTCSRLKVPVRDLAIARFVSKKRAKTGEEEVGLIY